MTEPHVRDGDHDDELVATDDTIIGRAFWWSTGVAVVLLAGIALGAWVMTRPEPVPPPTATTFVAPQVVELSANPPDVRFTDITAAAGIDFVHDNGAAGDKLLPETMGAGCAFFDYDNDDDPDLLLVNSAPWPENAGDGPPPTMALYRNDGAGRFANVTTGSGLDVPFYGTGVAIGDYDNDGWTDVFIAAVGANRLFRNVNGTFTDVTERARVGGDATRWSTSSAFFDFDNDGDLDLFVGNYVQWSRQIDFEVDYRLTGVGRAYGPPMNFQGTQPYLYRNNNDGTFTEVAQASGMHVVNPATGVPVGKALAVAPFDIDRDGWIDLLVANDTVANFMFHNQGGGHFVETAAVFGLAYGPTGRATGAMGIDVGFHRNDDALGFFIGNFANEMTSVYVSQGAATMFADEAIGHGIGAPSRRMLTFGLFLFDYDLDGRLDLLAANGHLEEHINQIQPSQHYEQPVQLFWNVGPDATQTFVPVSPEQTGDLSTPLVGRAAGYADIDGDGDLDVLITQVGRRPRLFRNDQQLGHNWLRIKLVGTMANRNAIGALIELDLDGAHITRQVMPARSYLAQVELPVTIGLGPTDAIDQIRITWPGGKQQTVANPPIGRRFKITQK